MHKCVCVCVCVRARARALVVTYVRYTQPGNVRFLALIVRTEHRPAKGNTGVNKRAKYHIPL